MIEHEQPNRVSEPELPKIRRPVLARVFGSLIAWFLAFAALIAAAGFWAYLAFTAPGPLADKKIYEIEKNKSRAEIAVALQDQGIIADARVFSAAAAALNIRGARLKAGEFEFPKGASMQEVLAMVTAGRFMTYKVAIPEGWTTQMVVARLQEQAELEGPITTIPPEGSILPDTYVFRRGLTRQKLLEDMQAAETKLLDEIWKTKPADSIIKTKEELVTLASIVEKETGVAEERPQVASVFINRLKQGMRLQSDPTIIYGIVGGKGRLDRAITKADIESATPYNTYQIPALPPGPIANPGKAALLAVLNPDQTPYLYFVANGTGGHAFAASLEEHNANVKKWRAQQNEADVTVPVVPTPATAAVPEKETTADSLPVPADPAAESKPADGQAAEVSKKPKPGETITINGKKVPIPVLKKPKK